MTEAPQIQSDVRAAIEAAERALRIAEQVREDGEETKKAVEEFRCLRKYAPPVAAKRERSIRLAYEAAGLMVAAGGCWWIYPPSSLLLIGLWVLADVIASRRKKGTH